MAEPSAPISSLPPPYPAAIGIYPPPNVVHCNPVQGHPEMIKTTAQYQQQPAVQQVQMMTTCMFGDNPQNAFCPTCNRQVITRVEKVNGTLVWLMVLLLMFLTAGLLCFVPLCIESLKDTEHFCPNCRTMLGRKNKM